MLTCPLSRSGVGTFRSATVIHLLHLLVSLIFFFKSSTSAVKSESLLFKPLTLSKISLRDMLARASVRELRKRPRKMAITGALYSEASGRTKVIKINYLTTNKL